MKTRLLLIALLLSFSISAFGLQPQSASEQNQSQQSTVEQLQNENQEMRKRLEALTGEMETYRGDVRAKIQELDEQEGRWTTWLGIFIGLLGIFVGLFGGLLPYLYNREIKKDFRQRMTELKDQLEQVKHDAESVKEALSRIEILEKDIRNVKLEIDKKSDKTKEYYDSILSFENDKNYYFDIFTSKISSPNSDSPSDYYSKAMLLCLKRDYQEALQVMNEAIKQDPTNSDYYTLRGMIYMYLKKYEEALSDYSKVINLNPEDKTAYLNRAKCYKRIAKEESDETIKNYYLQQAQKDEDKANSLE